MDQQTLTNILLFIMTAIMTGGIPWGYWIGHRLARIEVALEYGAPRFIAIENRLDRYESRLMQVERHVVME